MRTENDHKNKKIKHLLILIEE